MRLLALMTVVLGVEVSEERLQYLLKYHKDVKIERACYHTHSYFDRPKFDTSKFLTPEDMAICLKRTKFESLSPEKMQEERYKMIEEGLVCREDHTGCYLPGPQATLLFGNGMQVCVDCKDALEGGAWFDTWEAHFGPVEFQIGGKLTIGLPNDGSTSFYNGVDINGTIAVAIRRGTTGISDIVYRAQEAGAIAVVIIEGMGECDASFVCGNIIGDRLKDTLQVGFGKRDTLANWRNAYIPAVMVTEPDGKRLLEIMGLQYLYFEGYGHQYVP